MFKHNKHVENYSKKYLEKVLSGENLVSGELEDDEIAQSALMYLFISSLNIEVIPIGK